MNIPSLNNEKKHNHSNFQERKQNRPKELQKNNTFELVNKAVYKHQTRLNKPLQ